MSGKSAKRVQSAWVSGACTNEMVSHKFTDRGVMKYIRTHPIQEINVFIFTSEFALGLSDMTGSEISKVINVEDN